MTRSKFDWRKSGWKKWSNRFSGNRSYLLLLQKVNSTPAVEATADWHRKTARKSRSTQKFKKGLLAIACTFHCAAQVRFPSSSCEPAAAGSRRLSCHREIGIFYLCSTAALQPTSIVTTTCVTTGNEPLERASNSRP